MTDRTDMHLGRRLRQRRWFLGLTQAQVGERVGIKFQQVQKYETGQNRISASRLWELAQALDAPISYFYEGLDEAEAAAPKAEITGIHTDRPTDLAPKSPSADVMGDREAIELLRAYYAIPETPRRRLFDLARALGEAAGADDPDAPGDHAATRHVG